MKKLLSIILLIVICSSAFAQPFKAIREVNFKRAYIDSLIRVDYLAATSTGYSLVVYDSVSKTFRQIPASTYSTGCGDSTGGGGTGSVTSVGISSTDINVTGTNPIVSSGTFTLTLPTVNAHPGTFGNSHKIPIITANAKGLVTNLDSVDISVVDTTLFPAYVDSTGQPYQRILVAGRNGKIASDSMLLYNFAQNKVVINAKTSAKFGSAIKLYVNGGTVVNGIIARENGKANQFLKADGSLDTTHYVKSVSVNGTTFNVDTTTGNVDLGTISSGSGGSVTSVGLTSTDFDITGSPITSAGAFTANLKTVNSNIGTFNNVTVNAKGQVTAASNVSYLTTFNEVDPDYNANGLKLAGAQTLLPGAVKTFPASSTSNPSIVIQSGSAYTGTTTGATWINSNHIWTYLNGAAQQLDNQASLGNVILNQTTQQTSANFNIDGSGKVGSLTFNTLPASGTTTDSFLTVNAATGAVRKIANTFILSPKTPITLTDATTVSWNYTLGYNASVTLGGNRTLSISNMAAGDYGTLKIIQDATGNRTLTLPSNSKVNGYWGTGSTINLSTAASTVDMLSWYYDGINFYWTLGKNYQ